MSLSLRFKEVRKVLNMPQKDLAKALSISNSYLADIENEHRKVNERIVKLACMVFGINENWLKTGSGVMFYKSPDEKMKRLINIFNQLPTDFQDYALQQIDQLLELRKKTIVRGKNQPA